MKKIGWRIYTVFALAFIGTLIVTTPASLLTGIVERGSNGQLVLANATGTAWQGNATPAIRQRAGGLLVLEKLHWDIEVMPFFTGKIRIKLNWDNVEQAQPMLATITFSQVEIRNAFVPLHAGILGELSPMLQPAQLSGQMQIQSELITISRQGITGGAVVEWTNAGSVLSQVHPLGSYRINLAGAGERLDVALVTTSGALLIEGTGSFTRNQGLNFQATARAAAGSKGILDELLSNFGPESAPGVHSLNLMH